ncbi:MAG: PQQ-binding-like beta-propeller repeat protein, partial [Kiritimatiellae bacterium]|nr:PQQ-binding-like beta-propeller repeat protein [Kiritimatiellia bacterium]
IYCRSVITGELRWRNDTGGRVTWQNRDARQYPHEDLLIHEGLVFSPMYKVGPTLVALDLVTGQIRWAYGPMTASTEDEARLRFECAPAGGPRSVYASYIQDNIVGDTHVDTGYGVIAFDSATGQVLWRREVCRLRPEKFAGGFAVRHRNRIRSFSSPPLYHEGTVYYCSNAGAIAALDALSGRVKWCIRYPYIAYPQSVHDATRQFGGLEMYENNPLRHHRPMFWYGQRPLLVGESLYVTPVDSPFLYRIDRRTGKVQWSRRKQDDGSTYFMGPAKTGELIVVNSFRHGGGVHLLDPATGETVWVSGDPLEPMKHPVMNYYYDFGSGRSLGAMFGRWDYQVAARPFLSDDGHVCFTSFKYWAYPVWGWSCSLCEVSIPERKVVARRRYFSGEILARAASDIAQAPGLLKTLEELPHKDAATLQRMKEYKEIAEDTVPINEHGPFLPFSRLTFRRHGVQFELRTGPRTIGMVYDREALKKLLTARNDTESLFARAELAMGESRLDEAAALMERCLAALSSEDVDLRALVNQQLHEVYRRLAVRAIRSGNVGDEVTHCLNMRRTAVTLAQEIETLFALAEAYERKGDREHAAMLLRSIIATYGHYPHLNPALASCDPVLLLNRAREIIGTAENLTTSTLYGELFRRTMELMRKELPVYFGTLSPVRPELTIRAGDLAAARLVKLCEDSPEFASTFEQQARTALAGATPEEQLVRLCEFPATRTAQEVLNGLFLHLKKKRDQGTDPAFIRKELWRLADLARICRLAIPEDMRAPVLAPPSEPPPAPLLFPVATVTNSVAEERGTASVSYTHL